MSPTTSRLFLYDNGVMSVSKNVSSVSKLKDRLPPKEKFSEWYHELIQRAEIMDVRYPVKGLYVWFPFGCRIRREVYKILREIMDREHEEVYFPALIPETELGKESKHIKGFENEVYWVTHGGRAELDIRLALRPTSETAMYPMFKLWIRSHADLPLRVYQIVNTFRYETKHTRPLIRLREITSFKEAHTVHATFEEAEEQVRKAVNYYKEFYRRLAIPYIICKRPEWDKFPGAKYTIAFDTIMPDGKTLQIGTAHNLGDSFAKTFDITYEMPNGDHSFVYQTCYGISERCIAALISVHGDDFGLVLPFEVSPVQIAVIPVLYKGKEREVLDAARELGELLKTRYRVVVDESDERPGAKYYRWELKGAAIRVEIGPKEVEDGSAVVSFRDEKKKFTVSRDEVLNKIECWANEMRKRLYEKALNEMKNRIKFCKKLEDVKNWINQGVALVHLCNSEKCGMLIDEVGSLLGEVVDIPLDIESSGKCIICGKEGKLNAVARTY